MPNGVLNVTPNNQEFTGFLENLRCKSRKNNRIKRYKRLVYEPSSDINNATFRKRDLSKPVKTNSIDLSNSSEIDISKDNPNEIITEDESQQDSDFENDLEVTSSIDHTNFIISLLRIVLKNIWNF